MFVFEMILIVFVFVLLNGFFVMFEMLVMILCKSCLKQMVVIFKCVVKVLEFLEKLESFLFIVQIGIIVIGVLIGYFGGDVIGDVIVGWLQGLMFGFVYVCEVGIVLVVLLIIFIMLIFGELVFKCLVLICFEVIVGLVVMLMSWLVRLVLFFVWFLFKIIQLVLKVLGLGKDEVVQVIEEEIWMLVVESYEVGVIDVYECDMMNCVMCLGDCIVDSLMILCNWIVWFDIQVGLECNLDIMVEYEFLWYLVYCDNDMDVVGVLELKLLVMCMVCGDNVLFQILCELLYVFELIYVMKLLEIFCEEQQLMVLVVDEYGEIQGLVIISDLMGVVVGCLQVVENVDEDVLVVICEDGLLLVDGLLLIEDLCELIGSNELFDVEDGDYYMLVGMCIYYFGCILYVGEYFDWVGWCFEVVDLDGVWVDKLLLCMLFDEQVDEFIV